MGQTNITTNNGRQKTALSSVSRIGQPYNSRVLPKQQGNHRFPPRASAYKVTPLVNPGFNYMIKTENVGSQTDKENLPHQKTSSNRGLSTSSSTKNHPLQVSSNSKRRSNAPPIDPFSSTPTKPVSTQRVNPKQRYSVTSNTDKTRYKDRERPPAPTPESYENLPENRFKLQQLGNNFVEFTRNVGADVMKPQVKKRNSVVPSTRNVPPKLTRISTQEKRQIRQAICQQVILSISKKQLPVRRTLARKHCTAIEYAFRQDKDNISTYSTDQLLAYINSPTSIFRRFVNIFRRRTAKAVHLLELCKIERAMSDTLSSGSFSMAKKALDRYQHCVRKLSLDYPGVTVKKPDRVSLVHAMVGETQSFKLTSIRSKDVLRLAMSYQDLPSSLDKLTQFERKRIVEKLQAILSERSQELGKSLTLNSLKATYITEGPVSSKTDMKDLIKILLLDNEIPSTMPSHVLIECLSNCTSLTSLLEKAPERDAYYSQKTNWCYRHISIKDLEILLNRLRLHSKYCAKKRKWWQDLTCDQKINWEPVPPHDKQKEKQTRATLEKIENDLINTPEKGIDDVRNLDILGTIYCRLENYGYNHRFFNIGFSYLEKNEFHEFINHIAKKINKSSSINTIDQIINFLRSFLDHYRSDNDAAKSFLTTALSCCLLLRQSHNDNRS